MKGIPKDSKKLILRASLISVGIIGFIIMILNVNASTSVTAQTYQTPNGPQTNIVSSCVSTPNIPGNTLCNLSNNINNKTIPILDGNCANGGISVNNICPTSVVPLSVKPVTTTTIPTITADPIQIIPVVTIIDDSGNVNQVKTDSTTLFLNSLTGSRKLDFIATTDNILIDKGQIKLQIQLQGRPNATLTASGILWVYVNGVSINPSGVKFAVNNVAGQNGLFVANLDSPTGSIPGYTFDIQNNLPMLPKTANILSFNMSNIMIQNEKGQKFTSSQQQKFFSIEIDNMQYMIIQKNAQGQLVRVYPSDDTISISSSSKPITSSIQVTTHPCKGCTGYGYVTVTNYSPIPAVGSANVYQEFVNGTEKLLGTINSLNSGTYNQCPSVYSSPTGCLVAGYPSITGGGTNTLSNIPEDIDVRLSVSDPNSYNNIFHTMKGQHNYVYTCYASGCSFS